MNGEFAPPSGSKHAETDRFSHPKRKNWVNNLGSHAVSSGMKHILLSSLESLLSIKQQRLSLTRSLRSRTVLKREIQHLRHQIEELRAKPL
jgi:hypothetical protein